MMGIKKARFTGFSTTLNIFKNNLNRLVRC